MESSKSSMLYIPDNYVQPVEWVATARSVFPSMSLHSVTSTREIRRVLCSSVGGAVYSASLGPITRRNDYLALAARVHAGTFVSESLAN